MEAIEFDAFLSCNSLKCIYFYYETFPIVASDPFSECPASNMTYAKYQRETFGVLNFIQRNNN